MTVYQFIAVHPREAGGHGWALVIVQPTQYGVRRLVAAFRAMRRQVAALHKLTHRAER